MVTVRKAENETRSDVALFLHEEMNPNISHQRWLGLLDRRWAADDAGYAIIAEADGKIVGVLVAIYADRNINGRDVRTCNLSSWYIMKSHRGGGLGFKMMSTALLEPGVTFTTYSSNAPALSVCLKAGMTTLETNRLVWHTRGEPAKGELVVIQNIEIAAHLIDSTSRKAIRDHADLNVHPLVFRTENGDICTVVFSKKRKGEDIEFNEALYISDREVFAMNARALADAILPSTKALMSVDSRLLSKQETDEDEAMPLPVNRGFQSAGLEAHEMDFLYSEIPLLDLKLY